MTTEGRRRRRVNVDGAAPRLGLGLDDLPRAVNLGQRPAHGEGAGVVDLPSIRSEPAASAGQRRSPLMVSQWSACQHVAIKELEHISDRIRLAGVQSFGDAVDRNAPGHVPSLRQLDYDTSGTVPYGKRRQHGIEGNRGRLLAQSDVGHHHVVLPLG